MPRCVPLLVLFISMGGSLTARPGVAAWQPNGVRVCGNADSQDVPSIASDGAGGAYVLWRDLRDYTVTDLDHYLQHVTADGNIAPGWPADGVPLCTAPGPQFFVESLIADGQGGVIATWWDRRSGSEDDVYAQRMTAQGTPAPGWPMDGVRLTAIYAGERHATLASDDAGGAYVVWQDGRSGVTFDIYATHVLGDGTVAPGWPENGLPVCTLGGNEQFPRPIPDGTGGVLVVWSSGAEIRAVRLNAAGERVAGWAENGNLVLGLSHFKVSPLPVSDGAGGMFMVWMDFRSGPPDNFDTYADLYAQRVQADGTLAPGWPVDGLALCTAPRAQGSHDVAPDGAGGFLVAWGDSRDFSAEATDVYALRVRGDGTLAPGWTAGGVRVSNEPGYQLGPVHVAEDGLGGMYVAYSDLAESGEELAVQYLTAAGVAAPGWPTNGRHMVDIFGGQENEAIVSDGAGGAIVAWTDYRGDLSNSDIYAQRIGPDGPTPVLVSLVSAEAEPGLVRLTWFAGDGASFHAAVERRSETTDWERLTSLAADGTGKLSYEDREVVPGMRYAYRLAYPDGAGTGYSAEAWVTVPALRFALRGLTPNPSAGDAVVVFSLATADPASLELYDLGGRLVGSRDVGSLGGGAHTVPLAESGRLPAGVYTVRLRQGASIATTRAVIVR